MNGLSPLPHTTGKGLAAWRCPLCRATIKETGIIPTCDLPSEVRGRQFIQPAQLGLPTPASQGPLLAVHSFTAAAHRALQEGHPAASASGRGCSNSSSHGVGPVSLLRFADSLLPPQASEAAAAALASLAAQQLLHPTGRSPAVLLTLVGGSFGVGLALLAAFMHRGLVTLCRASVATGSLFGLPAHDCAVSEGSPHQLALQLVVVAETAGIWAVLALAALERRGRGGSFTKVLLHMQRLEGPALAFLLLRLLLAVLLAGTAVLLLAMAMAFTVVILFSLLAWLPAALAGI